MGRVSHRRSMLKWLLVGNSVVSKCTHAKLTGREKCGKKRCESKRDGRSLKRISNSLTTIFLSQQSFCSQWPSGCFFSSRIFRFAGWPRQTARYWFWERWLEWLVSAWLWCVTKILGLGEEARAWDSNFTILMSKGMVSRWWMVLVCPAVRPKCWIALKPWFSVCQSWRMKWRRWRTLCHRCKTRSERSSGDVKRHGELALCTGLRQHEGKELRPLSLRPELQAGAQRKQRVKEGEYFKSWKQFSLFIIWLDIS